MNDGKDKRNNLNWRAPDNFVDDIEDEIRTENWQRLWMKYGKAATLVCSAALLFVGVYSMWQKKNLADTEAISARYTTVQNLIMMGKQDTALPQIRELASVSKKNYALLSRFEHAAILRDKMLSDALAEYKAIYEDKKVDETFRELAYVFYVNAALDLLPVKEIDSAIDGFIENLKSKYIGGSWDLLAKEALAFCYMKKGDTHAAREALEVLAKTNGITPGMSERAKMLLHSLGE